MRKTLWIAVVLAAALISLGVVTAASGNNDKGGSDSGKTEEPDKKGHKGNDDSKTRTFQAQGTDHFTLLPTCDLTGMEPENACAFDPATGILTITFLDPNTLTGPFKGHRVLIFEVLLDTTKEPNTFTSSGHAVFNGWVHGCGFGTVVFNYAAEGTVDAEGNATTDVGDFTINPVGTTLPIEGKLSETGFGPTDPETMMGSLDYVGEYTCDRNSKSHKGHHGHMGNKHGARVHHRNHQGW